VKVLLYSPAFLPQIGGLELNVAHLATGFARRGLQVVVVTRTAGPVEEELPFPVVRRPSPRQLLRLVRWCDVFFQANVSLKGLWPLALVRRPWVVSHHSWYRRADGRVAWRDRLKRRLLRRAAASIAVSQAIADDLLPRKSVVIPNAYRDHLFRRLDGIQRTQDLVFVGRLVSDKGVDLLLEALARLAAEDLHPRLTVVGHGPEDAALRAQARRLGLDQQVSFLGLRTGEELVRLLNAHRVLVVPSRYEEPFGIVALEGIACGCVVAGSEGGGLKQAIGPCGPTFPNGDVARLAEVLAELLRDAGAAEALARYRREAAAHLARHGSERILDDYVAVLATVHGGQGSGGG
jgi:glycosyltransferase involved in cell wall biosynthesis